MPQIGWFEILIVVVVAILIIGPKDFPVMLKKLGNYFKEIQNEVTDIEDKVEEEMSLSKDFTETKNKKDE